MSFYYDNIDVHDGHIYLQNRLDVCVVYYCPQTKFAKVMFLHVSVSHCVHGGGACVAGGGGVGCVCAWPGGHAWHARPPA